MRRRTGTLLLLLASLCFPLGITLPIVRLEKLYFFQETPSILELVAGLWGGGNAALSAIVFLVSVLFPLAKLAVMFAILGGPTAGQTETRLHRWMGFLAKWSMMDVLIVALVIFAAKTSGFATAIAQPGLWFYAVSVVAGASAPMLLARR